MSIVVFWIQVPEQKPYHRCFLTTELDQALTFCNNKRNERDVHHVSLCSENPNSIGKPGVAAVENGQTPDGLPYTWMKRRTQ